MLNETIFFLNIAGMILGKHSIPFSIIIRKIHETWMHVLAKKGQVGYLANNMPS